MSSMSYDEALELEREVCRQLLATCPESLPVLHEYNLRFWHGNPPEDVNPYIDLAWFNGYLIDQAKQQQTSYFPAVFAMIEKLLVEGPEQVQNWVGVGVLEGLMNQTSHTDLGYATFEVWMGPETRKEWEGLIEYWDGL